MSTGSDHLDESASENQVNGFIGTPAPIQLDQHHRRNPDRAIADVGSMQGASDPLMSQFVLAGTGESGQRLAVKDQDGHRAS